MKILLMAMILAFCQNILAATPKKSAKKKKEIVQDKVYTVEKNNSEIVIGDPNKIIEENKLSLKRSQELWSFGFVRSNLRYNLPTITTNSLSFSPVNVGVFFGKKIPNQFLLYKGYYEISGEWQRFERSSAINSGLVFSQKLDLYQLNFFQNFNLSWSQKHSLLFSLGIGGAPLFLTTEQSVFGNSSSDLGYMGMLKGNLIVPFKKSYELDFALRIGWGSIGSRDIYHSALSFGLNFE